MAISTCCVLGAAEVVPIFEASLKSAGFKLVDSSEAQAVITFELTQTALEERYFGTEGLVATCAEDALLIDCSAATSLLTRELYQMTSVVNRDFVAAPVVIEDVCAQDAFSDPANVSVFAGGDKQSVARALPLLEALADGVELFGSAEQAQVAKMSHTIAQASALVGLIEAQSAFMLDVPAAEAVYAEQNDSSQKGQAPSDSTAGTCDLASALQRVGAITPAQAHFLTCVKNRTFSGEYTVMYLLADLSAALMALEDHDAILPQADATFHVMELLALVGGGAMNPAALSLVFAEEDVCQQFGLDWNSVSDQGDECGCGHDHDDCGCDHDHGHGHDDCGCDHQRRRPADGSDIFDESEEWYANNDGDLFGFSAN